MPLRSGGPAPYAPPKTVLDLIANYRDRSLRVPFNAEVLMLAGVSDGLVNRTLQALRLLDLIDEQGNPTAPLEGLKRAPSSEFKTRLEAVVRDVYGEVFQFADPTKDDTDRITDAFRVYEPAGQRSRMVTLFIGLCEAAGIITEGKKPAPSVGRAPATPRSPGRARTTNNREREHGPSVGALAPVRGYEAMIPPALIGLLATIPFSKGWTQKQHTKFLDTFKAVLDYSVPIISEAEAADKKGDG